MTDYDKLAERLKGMASTNGRATDSSNGPGINLSAIYEIVKLHVDSEIEKANEELCKRRLPTLQRVFLPSYHGRLCLTIGSDLLCTVDLHEAKGRIIAIISGPPNGYEISRKEFPLTSPRPVRAISGENGVNSTSQYGPRQIAVEIVSGLLLGSFS